MSSNIPGMSPKTREAEYEKLVDIDKPYKKVMALKALLVKEPENVLSFAELGKKRANIGLSRKSRFINLISKYPAVFALYRDESSFLWCGFSPQAQALVDQERDLVRSYESVSVQKLRKILMMSVDHRIRVPKIAQLRRDLGLPADFHSRMIYAYPQYFKVLEDKYGNEDGPILELTSWDPSLAVTSMETRAKAGGEFNSSGDPLFKMSLPRSFRLSVKQKEGIQKFQERIYISPYADTRDFIKNTPEFEKHQVAILHEILSMTIEKKVTLDYLTHFRKEYRLPHALLSMVLRHNCIFYVSRKGGRFTVFLKEAYKEGHLIERNEWNIIKENFMKLMDNRTFKGGETANPADKESITVEKTDNADPPVEEDSEFNALIALCRKIQDDTTKGNMPLAECKTTVMCEPEDTNSEKCRISTLDRVSVEDGSSNFVNDDSDDEDQSFATSSSDDSETSPDFQLLS
ncbi:hypothetical protein KP509_32G063400 [Ceratopteris richardii]|nr:hypothetical protein KP509_32G063400 [Ceratopteris richardii]